MASDATFRVSADVVDYISKMHKANMATKNVARTAASIGDAVGASIVKIEVLNRALNAAGRAISGVMNKATSASQTAGERAIGLATSLGSLGVRDINATTRTLSSGAGGTTADEKAQFAKALAQVNKQRRTKLTADEAQAALEAFAQFGEFGFGERGEDLLSGIGEGRSLESIMKAGGTRFDRIRAATTDPMSPLSQGLRGRFAESEAQRVEESRFLVSGTSERAQQAGMRVTAANDPGGPVSIVQGMLGDTAATVLNRTIGAAVGAEDAAARATEKAAAASVSMADQWRKVVTSPNFATETR